MSTPATAAVLDSALSNIPREFRKPIIKTYLDLRAAYAEGTFDAAGLRAAKFCEASLRFLQQNLTGKSISFTERVKNFSDECDKLEKLPAVAGHETLRVIIPRGLKFIYTLRNKRGVGHIAGDVDANEIDAATSVRVADWCVCELMRFFHSMSLEDAQALLDAVAVRQLPEVWSIAGKQRVLASGLSYKFQVLLLLYRSAEPGVLTEDLQEWVEHPRLRDLRRDVLIPLHSQRLVEYDQESETVTISPKGAKKVEEEILPKLRTS